MAYGPLSSMILIIAFLMFALFYIMQARRCEKKKNSKSLQGWLAFGILSLILWALFHLALNLNMIPPNRVEAVHYLFSHAFILIASIAFLMASHSLSTHTCRR